MPQNSDREITTSLTIDFAQFENDHIKSVADQLKSFKVARSGFRPSPIMSNNLKDMNQRKQTNDQTPLTPLYDQDSKDIITVYEIPLSGWKSKNTKEGLFPEKITT